MYFEVVQQFKDPFGVNCNITGIIQEICVDGPKAHQHKFPWALRPGVWGPPRPPLGSRGNAPVGGPGWRSPPAENDSRHFYAPRNTSPGINFHFFNCLSEV